SQVSVQRLAFMVFWVVVFTLAYAQAPLFTSNQNQYFLHGLAEAGYGNLSEDWLSNTLDPTPVFSWMIGLTYRLVTWTPIFYLYFGILAGVYLFSLLGIVESIFEKGSTSIRRWGFLALITVLQSAGLRYFFNSQLGVNWNYLFDGGAAGQRLLGEVLQPSAFGVLLLLSIYLFLREKTWWAVVPLVLAPTIHPTYLLGAAILTLIYMGLIYQQEKKLWAPIKFGAAALLGVMPILIYTFSVYRSTSAVATTRARDILVNFRIPHHALPEVWFDVTSVIKIGFLLAALYLVRKHTKLFVILAVPTVIGGILTGAQMISGSHVLALLFPWRLSAFLIPVSVSVIAAWSVGRLNPMMARFPEGRVRLVLAVIALGAAGAGIAKFNYAYQEKENSPDQATLAYIETHKSASEVYLIPLDWQNFRLETGAPAYVEFKSIPYQEEDVLEWYRRVSQTGKLYQATMKRQGCKALDGFY
ncbi:MAG: DUF6798 domain-containing protein, partial [Chloroflexota bacterium]